jgi:hypothetical protein
VVRSPMVSVVQPGTLDILVLAPAFLIKRKGVIKLQRFQFQLVAQFPIQKFKLNNGKMMENFFCFLILDRKR